MNETYLETPSAFAPQPPQKNSRLGNIIAILLGLFSLVMFCALIGLGYVAYSLDQDLTTARADIATLTNDKNKLTTDLNSTRTELDSTKNDLNATKADLESTKAELATAKSDLDSARTELATLHSNVDKALKYLNILDGFWGDTYAETEVKIKATGDSALLSSYRVWEKSGKNSDFYNFFDDLVGIIIDLLK